jgi:hypothetical protein
VDIAFGEYSCIVSWSKDIIYAWANLSKSSPFLCLMEVTWCRNGSGGNIGKAQLDIDALPGAFLYQVMRRMKVSLQ